MQQHQIDTMVDRRDRRAPHCQHRHDRYGRKKIGRLVGAPLGIVLLCALTLSGCSSGGSSGVAEAQQVVSLQNKRIETFIIDVDSFVLKTDNPPDLEVRDSATVYVIQSDGDVTFQPSDGSPQMTLNLELNDVVIERPDVGTLTVMRDK